MRIKTEAISTIAGKREPRWIWLGVELARFAVESLLVTEKLRDHLEGPVRAELCAGGFAIAIENWIEFSGWRKVGREVVRGALLNGHYVAGDSANGWI
jgi:hypothetical protein